MIELILYGVLGLIGIIMVSKVANFCNNVLLYRRDWRVRYFVATLLLWITAGMAMGLITIWFITRLMHYATRP